MPSYQDQLKSLEEKERSYWPVFFRLSKFNKVLENLEVITILLAILLTILFFIILSKSVSIDYDWAGIIFYGGIALGAVLKWILKVTLSSLTHHLFNISKSEHQQFTNLETEIKNKKSEIKKLIEIQQREEKARLMRSKETLLANMLENLIAELINKNILKDEALTLKKKLEIEYQNIRMYGLQIHRSIYYTNRFDKINQLLNNSSSTEVKKNLEAPPIISEQYIPIESQEKTVTIELKIEEEEKDISEIFKPTTNSNQKTEPSKVARISPKADFENLSKLRHSIGTLGEEFIYQEEKRKLNNKGLVNLSERVQWISKESDSYGYDIKSFHEDGSSKYIEVKTTTEGGKTPFYLSELELNALDRLHPNYIICRVYDFNIETGKGSKYWVSKTQLETYFNLEPISYKVNPKKD